MSWFGGLSHRELQGFVEQAVAFAVEESAGASRLGYSYPGQARFLQKTKNQKQRYHTKPPVNEGLTPHPASKRWGTMLTNRSDSELLSAHMLDILVKTLQFESNMFYYSIRSDLP